LHTVDEKTMEDLIAANPEHYLGEPGLKLLDRQLKVGPYRFDLMFQDRTGAKLIVEIQKGTLDRVHTYKILDYYDEYKERNPKEFVEVMLVANTIPVERKQRLASRGIAYREIPLAEFVDACVGTIEIEVPTQNNESLASAVEKKRLIKHAPTMSTFALFLDQQKQFINALRAHDPNTWFPPLRGKFEKDVPSNWFICFVPAVWGCWKGNYGVHFDLIYARSSTRLPERFRLAIGVENPLNEQHRQAFKEEVISRVNAKVIMHSGFILKAQKGKKLLETDPIPFNSESWQIALNKYFTLDSVVNVIGEVIREYSDRGAFDCAIQFP
jgi:hypothetical protein